MNRKWWTWRHFSRVYMTLEENEKIHLRCIRHVKCLLLLKRLCMSFFKMFCIDHESVAYIIESCLIALTFISYVLNRIAKSLPQSINWMPDVSKRGIKFKYDTLIASQNSSLSTVPGENSLLMYGDANPRRENVTRCFYGNRRRKYQMSYEEGRLIPSSCYQNQFPSASTILWFIWLYFNIL